MSKVTKDGKQVDEAGKFVWLTYSQIAALQDQIGAAIVKLGLAPKDTKGGLNGMVGLYSKNRYEWVVAEHGAFSQNLVTVPLYDTLGAEAVAFIVNQTSMTTVFCSAAEVPKIISFKKDPATSDRMKSLVNVIVFEVPTSETRTKATEAGVTLYSFDEVLATGKANPIPHSPPGPDDIATICYTSGTTGDPKGALLTHRNLVAAAAGANYAGLGINNRDIYLSYLPLAHVFERLVQVAMWYAKAAVGFYQGDTLKLVEDLKELRPTVFCSVPRLYNRFYDRIISGAKAAGGLKASLFAKAYAAKQQGLSRNNELNHWLWDKLVFSKLAARLGLDRCRVMATGSAPIAAHVLEFLRIVFRAKVIEGYGQTECGGVATVTPIELQNRVGNVGGPLPYNEIKLVSIPEMGYKWTDTVHGADAKSNNPGIECAGRGEVCYRGLNVFKGYYLDPARTAEAIDSDGWLHSGDIGIWDATGSLRIVDRAKAMFKLSQGEYVAPEKIENICLKSSFIAQIFVYGDSLHSTLVGVVVPNIDNLRTWAKDNGKSDTATPAEISADPAVKKLILEDMGRVCKEAKLAGFEMVKAITLEPVAWTPDDLLTPSFKLKRADAKKKYADVVDTLYITLDDKVAGATGLKQA
jgi:long-chain acyl-CoA synthetase